MKFCRKDPNLRLRKASRFHCLIQSIYIFDISLVLELLPKDKQVIFLSATIPGDSLRKLIKDIMHDPVKILVKKEQLTLEGIRQFYIEMDKEEWKLETLCDLYTNDTFTDPTVVFRNSREKVDQLSAMLEERELSAAVTVRLFPFSLQLIQVTYPSIVNSSMAKSRRAIVKLVSWVLGQVRLGFW